MVVKDSHSTWISFWGAGHSKEITLGSPQNHTIFPEKDNDWLVFYPPAAGLYVLNFSNVAIPLKVVLWACPNGDDKQRQIAKFDVPRGFSQESITMQEYLQYIKIRIRAKDDDEGIYQVSIHPVQTTQLNQTTQPAQTDQPVQKIIYQEVVVPPVFIESERVPKNWAQV